MVAQTIDRFGTVDILVNNAGVAGTSPIPNITEELWDRNIAVNLKAVFLCTQAVFGHMCERGRGHIVNVSSLAGRYPVSQVRRLRRCQVRRARLHRHHRAGGAPRTA